MIADEFGLQAPQIRDDALAQLGVHFHSSLGTPIPGDW